MITRPSQRREMAVDAVAQNGVSIALACRIFGVSERCYRYEPKLKPENERIVDLLMTFAHRTWGFGLCYPLLRNVKGHLLNHKRVFRLFGLKLRRVHLVNSLFQKSETPMALLQAVLETDHEYLRRSSRLQDDPSIPGTL